MTSCSAALTASSFVTRTFYDGLGRKIAEVDAEGDRTEWEYDAAGNLTRLVDPRTFDPATPGTFETRYEYDKRGHLEKMTESVGVHGNDEVAVYRYQYNAAGLLTKVIDPRGENYTTEFQYDALQRAELIKQSFPGETGTTTLVTRNVYDAVGNLVQKTDPRGDFFTVQYTYDALGRRLDTLEPTGTPAEPGPLAKWSTVRDAAGNVIEMRDPRGDHYTIRWSYDALGRVERMTVPTGSAATPGPEAVTDYTYYPGGTVRTKTLPAVGQSGARPVITTTYNQVGLVLSKVDEIGAITNYSYDAAGNLKTVTELATTNSPQRLATFDYDQLDRLTTTTDAEGFTTTTSYDAAGNQVRVEGPFRNSSGRQITTWTYDGKSRVRSITDAEGNTTSMQYDLVGNRTRLIDPRGTWADVVSKYDGANRLIQIDQPTGTASSPGPVATMRMEYDGAGYLVKQIDPRGAAFATTYQRDYRGHEVLRQVAGGTASDIQQLAWTSSYDAAGFLTETVDPRGPQYKTTYQRDVTGKPLTITYPVFSPGGASTLSESYRYDAAGNLLEQTGMGGAGYVTTFDYDGRNRMILRTDAVGDTQKLTYDRYNNVIAKSDYLGTTTFEFDGINRLVKTTDALGNVTRQVYQPGGLAVQSTSPRGFSTTTTMDRLGRKVEETDPLGRKSTIKYDSAGNAVEYSDKAGVRTQIDFDARNLITREVAAVGTAVESITRHQYDLLGRKVATIDPRGDFYRTTFEYDNQSRLIAEKAPAGSETTVGIGTPGAGDFVVRRWSYDAIGHTISATPARGDFYRTDYVVDGLGRIVSMSKQVGTPANPERVSVEHRYDNAGNKISTTDELGFETRRTYDKVGRILSEEVMGSEPGIGAITYKYVKTEQGYQVETYNRDQQLQQAVLHDGLGRAVHIDNLTGDDITNVYDHNVLASTTQGTNSTTYLYDELDRVQRETDQLQKFVSYTYDAVGNLKTVSDKDNFTTTYEYDQLNRQRIIENPLQGRTQTDYDAAGHVVKITSPTGDVTELDVDALGQPLAETTSDGTRTFQYDPAGNLVSSIDRNGREIRRQYDGNNLLVREDWHDGDQLVHSITADFDAGGRKRTSSDGEVTNTWSYVNNATYWLKNSTVAFDSSPITTLNYTRRSSGEKLTMSIDLGSSRDLVVNTYTYNPNSLRLESIRQTGSFVADKSVTLNYFDNLLALQSIVRRDGTTVVGTTTYGLDARNQVNFIRHQSPTTTLNETRLTYNFNGLISTTTDLFDSRAYTYDQLKQLRAVDHSDTDVPDEVYAWDASGNRTVSTQHGTSYKTDANNRIKTDGVYDYQYDNEGNRVLATEKATGNKIQYGWDYRNRLTQVTYLNADGVPRARVTYTYDAENRRVARVADDNLGDGMPATLTRYIYDGDDVVLELFDQNATDGLEQADPHVAYLLGSGTDQIFAQDFGQGNYQWLLADAGGSITEVASRSGALLDHIQYDAFGRILQRVDPNVAVTYLFQSRPIDPLTGTYYFRAREYDPTLGIFLSTDPLSYGGGDTNPYRLALGNPVNFRDPTGMSVFSNPFARGLSAMNESLVQGNQAARNAFASTFIMGVYDSSLQTAAGLVSNLPQVLATKLPYVGQLIGLGLAVKTSYEEYKKGQYWNAVKGFIPMIFGMRGANAGVAASFAVNTVDAGIAIRSGDPNAIASFGLGMLFDIRDAKRSRLTLANAFERNAGGKGGFIGIYESTATTLGSIKKELYGIKSDIGQAAKYYNYVRRQERALASGATPLFDLNAPSVPRYTSDIFRFGTKLRAASTNLYSEMSGAPRGIPTEPNLRAEMETIAMVLHANKRRLDITKDIHATADKDGNNGKSYLTNELIQLEQRLLFSRAMDVDAAPVLPNGKARAAGVEYISHEQAQTLKQRDLDRVLNNSRMDPGYYKGVSKVVDRMIEKNSMNFSYTGRRTLIESFITMHLGVILRDPTGRASTIWKSIHAGKIDKALNDVGRRLEDFEYGQRYNTLEAAQNALADTQAQLASGKLNAGSSAERLKHQAEVLERHVGQFEMRNSAKATLDVFSSHLENMLQMRDPGISSAHVAYMGEQLSALNNLINKHQYSMPGPWKHLAQRLSEVHKSSDAVGEFLSILDTPFVSKETLTNLAEFMRSVNTGEVKMDSIRAGDLSAILLRGTAGATLGQINTRAEFVHAAFSGDLIQMRQQLSRPDHAWRTLSDLYKSPMQEQSDFDLNIVVRGGREKLQLAQRKSVVTFPGREKSQEIAGGEFLSKLIGHAPDGSELHQVANNQKIDDPFEIYIQDRAEFMNFTGTESYLNARVFKGAVGVVMMPDGSVRTVVSPSALFDSGSLNSITVGAISFAENKRRPGAALHADRNPVSITSTTNSVPTSSKLSLTDAVTAMDTVQATWMKSLTLTNLPHIEVVIEDLPNNQLAEAVWTTVDAQGQPTGGQIVLDDDAAGWKWFVDSTPWSNEEFDYAGRATGSSAAAGRYDLLTVLAHEYGHLLGFTQSQPKFADRTSWDHAGHRVMQVGSQLYRLDSTGNELDPLVHPEALMSATLSVGVRKRPTAIDTSILKQVLQADSESWVIPQSLGNVSGDKYSQFKPLGDAVAADLAKPLRTGIGNKDFSVTNSSSTAYAWHSVGPVSLAQQAATLTESVGMLTDLSQSFVIPTGTRSLSFTLTGIQLQLDAGGSVPSDAIEVALLKAHTTERLVSPMSGLGDSDALVSIQADGTIYMAPEVSIDGFTPGGKLDLSKPIDVTIDLPASAAGTAATLYFDLIGFGTDGSQFAVQNIDLATIAALTWHNTTLAEDTNNDGLVTPLDALLVINELNSRELTGATGHLPPITSTVSPPPFLDVTDDGLVTALDALLIINRLNNANTTGGGDNQLPTSWHNAARPLDANADNLITPLDALLLINDLNTRQISSPLTSRLPTITAAMKPAPYLDVNDDQLLTPMDALLIINQLNLSGGGEGERDSDYEDSLLELLAQDRLK